MAGHSDEKVEDFDDVSIGSATSSEDYPNEAQITLVGSIEVEAVQDEQSKSYVHRIMCVSPDQTDEYEVQLKRDGVVEPSFFESFETITHTLMESCGCSDYYPKSVLRKAGSVPISSDRNVSFSNLEIREFKVTLGEHPCATSGPPIAINWDSQSGARIVDVDEYERIRSPRRQRKHLKLRYKDRMGVLKESFTEDEVNRAWAEALQIRSQRKETLDRGMVWMLADDIYESACRKCRRASDTVSSLLFSQKILA